MSKNTQMYLDFFKGAWKYRKEIKKDRQWMNRYVQKQGFKINPHRMYLTQLSIWLEENKHLYGQQICPCFEASGDPSLDKKLICPCNFAAEDIATHGTCHCGLFGREDYSEADFKKAEGKVMHEYKIPLKWQGNTLDTRGQEINPLRGLPVPDAMHLFKQARNERPSLDFKILTEREQSAKNIKAYLNTQGYQCDITPEGKDWRLAIKR
ncbi:ferredoxin-thioredoxin reductase catalytic domain-containing protein [Desulfitobacterium metallireducens]|uniref:Uncharacterized protein n=1 Tax=Desulfitobacterium metallireducens DSM 15288 TaxID=871968 RepID=W0EHB2_9FIRM|nr:ferredoxin-thioredoxin reductase catalytic domain-containing protein [Desulfitobacterium metallireducens]AHF08461.1 hypothetical protein DESME_03750 [Desulfitobacterium metallireducens DSM 15288]